MAEQAPSGNLYRIHILDIDGTIMPTGEIDNQCFWRAVNDVLGGTPRPLDLHGFRHITDSGILEEWSARERRSPLSRAETLEVRARFLELTREAADRFPALFYPTSGLNSWIQETLNSGSAAIGFATGGWRHTARFKLASAGLGSLALPLASSDDAIGRTEIMRIALERTLAYFTVPEAAGDKAQITYIGDGIWDLEASCTLGWDFIGIADATQELTLKQAGARLVVRDFDQLRDRQA
jgi:phosphoglycolate phosphatase-like HAD superfamily hydrolase